MKRLAGMWRERAAAFLLLVTGLGASAWMHAEAIRTTAIARTRERQLEYLVTLAQPCGQRRVDERALASLGGLFSGQTVVWLHTSTGPVLSLADTSESERL